MDRSASDPEPASSASSRGAHAPTKRSAGQPPAKPAGGLGLQVERRFSEPGVHPFEAIEWEQRTAIIANEKGETVFTQENVEVPASWS
ncbi:MAG: hypothetical protein WB020_10235, partial [Candidatus Dormiibacterota bacterium]